MATVCALAAMVMNERYGQELLIAVILTLFPRMRIEDLIAGKFTLVIKNPEKQFKVWGLNA